MPQERNFYRVYFYDHLCEQGLKVATWTDHQNEKIRPAKQGLKQGNDRSMIPAAVRLV